MNKGNNFEVSFLKIMYTHVLYIHLKLVKLVKNNQQPFWHWLCNAIRSQEDVLQPTSGTRTVGVSSSNSSRSDTRRTDEAAISLEKKRESHRRQRANAPVAPAPTRLRASQIRRFRRESGSTRRRSYDTRTRKTTVGVANVSVDRSPRLRCYYYASDA